MLVWRITRSAHQAFDGEGAGLNGGRWNSEGRAVVYTSSTLSLAALELLVHVEPLLAPSDLVATEFDVPDAHGVGVQVTPDVFPHDDWRQYPAPEWQAELGDMWIEDGTFLWLAVPSAVVPHEFNILLNPRHASMGAVRAISMHPFSFDKRLL